MASTLAGQQAPYLLSRKESAERLGISIATFDRLRAAGQIQSVQIGPRRVGFTEDELQNFVRSHTEARSA